MKINIKKGDWIIPVGDKRQKNAVKVIDVKCNCIMYQGKRGRTGTIFKSPFSNYSFDISNRHHPSAKVVTKIIKVKVVN